MASYEGVIKFRLLPTLKLYKIGVKLDMVNSDPSKLTPDDKVKNLDQKKFELTSRDKDFIRELQKDLQVFQGPSMVLQTILVSQSTNYLRKPENTNQLV